MSRGDQGGILFGWNAVDEALRAGKRPVEKVFVARGRKDARSRRLEAAARTQGVAVVERPGSALDDLTRGANHQGVVALISPVKFWSLEEAIERAGENPLFVVLDGVEDPHNLGAVVRSSAAAGAAAVVLPSRGSAPLSGGAAKAAAGCMEKIPIVRAGNITQIVEKLKDKGIWVAGLDGAGDQDWTEVDWTGPMALVVGSEGKGVRAKTLKHCDFRVKIPMESGVESLNLSVATAVVLFEAVRQRRS